MKLEPLCGVDPVFPFMIYPSLLLFGSKGGFQPRKVHFPVLKDGEIGGGGLRDFFHLSLLMKMEAIGRVRSGARKLK